MGKKLSFYNIPFEHNGNYYIYNLLSVALVQLTEDLFNKIKTNDIESIDENYVCRMEKSGFIVDKNDKEYEKFLFYYNKIKYTKSAGTFSVTFIPTYNCNLACPYCMQGLDKSNDRINKSDIGRVISFCETEIDKSRSFGNIVNRIHADAFGGEPMLELDAVELFYKGILELAERKKCDVDFAMTSNFTLLNERAIDLIRSYNVAVQVTIDGTEKQHNRRRITKDGRGTYDVIIRNLQRIKEEHLEDHIVIRINIDEENLHEAEEIMKSVKDYSTDIYFGFLTHFEGNNDGYTTCVAENSYANVVTSKLDSIAKKYGFTTNRHFGKQSPCAICSENNYFVDFRGDVYKCEMLVNNPDMRVGVVSKDGMFIPEPEYYHQRLLGPDKYEECKNCKLLPMCAGGCAGKSYFMNLNASEKIEHSYCMYTEEEVIDYLKSYIDNNKNHDGE